MYPIKRTKRIDDARIDFMYINMKIISFDSFDSDIGVQQPRLTRPFEAPFIGFDGLMPHIPLGSSLDPDSFQGHP